MTIRFDADNDTVADEDPKLTDEWGSYEDCLWYLTDGMSNGRWLFVGPARPGDGVPVGIGRVYTKYLSAAAARSFAAAMLVAADEAETHEHRRATEREQARQRSQACDTDDGHDWGPAPLTVTHATSYVRSDGNGHVSAGTYRVCRCCEVGRWFDNPVQQ